MAAFFESLESRTFLSVAPSVAALRAENKVLVADLYADGAVGRSNYRLIYADVKAADEVKTSRPQLNALSVEGTAAYHVTARGVVNAVVRIDIDVARLIAAAARLAKHPTSALFQARVTAAANTLTTDAANRLATINADITAQHDTAAANVTDLEDVDATNTNLATDVSTTIASSASAARTALSDAASTDLTTDVNAVVAAYPA